MVDLVQIKKVDFFHLFYLHQIGVASINLNNRIPKLAENNSYSSSTKPTLRAVFTPCDFPPF
ncbi:hypothetical protein SAMN04487999_1010 [Leeuwenhoekiella palythoae]|uniref:Uncharacterized protein n=1 Tax=Leeuwenhoekiella palythoae TaxID=573501 RepID=A0A1M5W269_9FLAO|nr:hypothetical protein SAMN04487999_1010 [Leeuwenhoekiella palythoae]